jgi:hypothetical protein
MSVQSGVLQALSLASCALLLFTSSPLQAREQGSKKASLSLKATPSVSFAPARIIVRAELKGGGDDSEELYCPTVEWEWGDGTISTAETDCTPFEAGKSEIKRNYTVEHQYKNPGNFKVYLRLKKGSRLAVSATTTVNVRAGLGQEPGVR